MSKAEKNKPEKVATVSDFDIKELRAVLKTMSEDDHLIIHKLIIEQKESGIWRFTARVSREKDAAK